MVVVTIWIIQFKIICASLFSLSLILCTSWSDFNLCKIVVDVSALTALVPTLTSWCLKRFLNQWGFIAMSICCGFNNVEPHISECTCCTKLQNHLHILGKKQSLIHASQSFESATTLRCCHYSLSIPSM